MRIELPGLNIFISERSDGDMRDEEDRTGFLNQYELLETQLYLGEQVHGNRVQLINPSTSATFFQQTDGLASVEERVLLGVMVADCYPVALWSASQKAFALVHAGWRGVEAQIASQAFQLLNWQMKIDDWQAWIGPGISVNYFEVGQDVAEKFNALEHGVVVQQHSATFVNLRQTLENEFMKLGIKNQNIHHLNECTFNSPHWHSYRQDLESSGRMLVAITLSSS